MGEGGRMHHQRSNLSHPHYDASLVRCFRIFNAITRLSFVVNHLLTSSKSIYARLNQIIFFNDWDASRPTYYLLRLFCGPISPRRNYTNILIRSRLDRKPWHPHGISWILRKRLSFIRLASSTWRRSLSSVSPNESIPYHSSYYHSILP